MSAIRALFGQGPRVSHRWWETLHYCRRSHYHKVTFEEYVKILFLAGAEEFSNADDPGALVGQFRGVISSRTKNIPLKGVEITDDFLESCQNLAISSNDLLAIFVGIGYDRVCLRQRDVAA